jgi:hypothetical protein
MCYEIRRAEAGVDYLVCLSRTTERELCSWRVGHEEMDKVADNSDGWYKDHKLGRVIGLPCPVPACCCRCCLAGAGSGSHGGVELWRSKTGKGSAGERKNGVV